MTAKNSNNDIAIVCTESSTPIPYLPVEILSTIFQHGRNTDCIRDQRCFPTTVTHVNRYFRDIATHMPSLWTKIVLSHNLRPGKVCAFLERSGSMPFEVEIVVDKEGRTPVPQECCNVVSNLIIPAMSRCRRCAIHSHDAGLISALMTCFCFEDVNVPILESLEIQYSGNTADFFERGWRFILGGGTPALRSMYVKGWSMHQCLPPRGNVTSLTLLHSFHPMIWPGLKVVIGNMPSLVDLTIGQVIADNLHIEEYAHLSITLPSLLRLQFEGKKDEHMLDSVEAMIFLLKAPLLEEICFQYLDLIRISRLLPLIAQRMNTYLPQVHSISVGLLEELGQDHMPLWLQFCQTFPRTTRLTLGHFNEEFMPSVFRTLKSDSTHTDRIFSLLERIAFLESGWFDRHSGLLCGMVSQRATTGEALRTLCFPKQLLSVEQYVPILSRLRQYISVETMD